MPGPEVQILADQDGWTVKAVHHIYCWHPGILWVWPHALWAMQCTSHIPEVNEELPQGAESNILSHLPQWHNHLLTDGRGTHPPLTSHLWFREHHMKLKPSKCNFFRNEIICLAHWVWKEGVCPSNLNLKPIAECIQSQTYTKVLTFLSLVGHYRRFIEGFTCITQPLSEYCTGQGASKKSEQVSLTKDAMKALETLKQVCMTPPILVFTDYTKPFLLETNASKDRLGAVLSQKQADRWYHPIAYGSRALMPHEKNYHSTKLKFLVLKWTVTVHFTEYLPYQSFVVWTDNNPLTYIMLLPNLDATGHQWVSALALQARIPKGVW